MPNATLITTAPRRARPAASAIAIALLTGGCARFHARPLVPEQTATAFHARTLEQPALKAFLERAAGHPIEPWPPAAWEFSMLTLAALHDHPDVRVAQTNWVLAKAGRITAGAWPNPQVSFSPQYVADVPNTGISPWVLSRSFDLPIETAGKRRDRLTKAGYIEEAARWNLAEAAWRVRSRLRNCLLDLDAAIEEETLLTEQYAEQAAYAAAVEERLAVGNASPATVLQAKLMGERTLAAMRAAQQRRVDSFARCADALGVPSSALDRIDLTFPFADGAWPDSPKEAMRREALLARSDLLAALADYAASQANLQLEIAKQYPDLHLGPGYSWDQGTDKWTLGVTLTLPIFDRNQGPIAEAEAQRQQAADKFLGLQAAAIAELDRALADYEAARGTLRSADALLATQWAQYRLAQRRISAGNELWPTATAARAELRNAAVNRLHTFIDAQRALGVLEDAMRRPVDPCEPRVDLLELAATEPPRRR